MHKLAWGVLQSSQSLLSYLEPLGYNVARDSSACSCKKGPPQFSLFFFFFILPKIHSTKHTLNLNHWIKKKGENTILVPTFWGYSCSGSFCNCKLGCLLPRYGPMVLGRRVRTGFTATHPKPTCTQTKGPLLKLWSHAHGRGNCYKRVMTSRCNITTTKWNAFTVSQKTGNTKWNKGRSNAAI